MITDNGKIQMLPPICRDIVKEHHRSRSRGCDARCCRRIQRTRNSRDAESAQTSRQQSEAESASTIREHLSIAWVCVDLSSHGTRNLNPQVSSPTGNADLSLHDLCRAAHQLHSTACEATTVISGMALIFHPGSCTIHARMDEQWVAT